VLVILEDGGVLAPLSSRGGTVRHVRRLFDAPDSFHLYRGEGLNADETRALARELARQPGVKAALPNWIFRGFRAPDDEFYSLQWHYPAMNLERAWDLEDGSTSPVTVAVVDSGSIAHPDLQGQLLPGYDFITDLALAGDGDARDADPTDLGQESGYHGAHVAGTVAAATSNAFGVAGVSWGAKVVPVRALGVTGGGTLADILEGIFWAAGGQVPGIPTNPNPAKVINLSLGGDTGGPCSSELNEFFRNLASRGITIVAAAGNENTDVGTVFPAFCDEVVTVGATGPQGTRAPYSNYGAGVDVMAPGGDVSQSFTFQGQTYPAGVLSTVKDDATGAYTYAFYQGTSMASPHVAGLVALMLAREPGLTHAEIVARLARASTPLSATACNRPSGSDCGVGFVDAAAALGGGGAAPPPPPPTEALPTYVAALYCSGGAACQSFDFERSSLVQVEPRSNTVPYRLEGLSAGTYLAAGWQDLNADGEVDDGEPFGVYPAPLPLPERGRYEDITIYLEPFVPADAQAASKGRVKAALEAHAMDTLR